MSRTCAASDTCWRGVLCVGRSRRRLLSGFVVVGVRCRFRFVTGFDWFCRCNSFVFVVCCIRRCRVGVGIIISRALVWRSSFVTVVFVGWFCRRRSSSSSSSSSFRRQAGFR